MPKILLKSLSNPKQIERRIELIKQGEADGLELYGSWPVNEELIEQAFKELKIVHFEPNDYMLSNKKGEGTIYDLTDPLNRDKDRKERSREFIETSINISFKLASKYKREEEFLFNIHWNGNCNVTPEDNKLRTEDEIRNTNANLLEYYFNEVPKKINLPRNVVQHFLSFENVYHEAINDCPVNYTPVGRHFEDFPKDNITIDVAHKAMDIKMTEEALRNSKRINKGSYSFETYFGKRESKTFIKIDGLDYNTTQFVIEELLKFNPKQVHLANYKWVDTEKFKSWKDGYLEGRLELDRIIPHLKKVPFVVTEVAESTGDYINVPDQLKLSNMIKQYL